MYKKMFFISGLPRSGSTLLSSIMCQNPEIHSEGNSAVCQLMWDMKKSCENAAFEQLKANNKEYIKHDLISSIPKIYYKDVNRPVVIDKCRSWTLPENFKVIKEYITDYPKIIILTRPINEIIQSFINLRIRNGWARDLTKGLFDANNGPIMQSLYGVENAIKNNNGEFIFIDYKDLVENTEKVLKDIYDFLELNFYEHDYNNIKNYFPENDKVYGLDGMHEIRSSIGYRNE
jgi:sulfotransferase